MHNRTRHTPRAHRFVPQDGTTAACASSGSDDVRGRVLAGGFALILGAGLVGCAAPSISEQRLVSKPNMTFSESAAFAYAPYRLFPQLATGATSTGGPQNSGCTSCR